MKIVKYNQFVDELSGRSSIEFNLCDGGLYICVESDNNYENEIIYNTILNDDDALELYEFLKNELNK